MSAADATVIVPQLNRVELTIDCVRTFREWHDPETPLLVIDDGSAPHEVERFRSASLACGLIQGERRGVTAAWALGADVAESPLLVFLNNDTVTHGPWLERLLEPLRMERVRMTGVGWRRETQLPATLARTLGSPSFLPGWCFALARSTLQTLGGFDLALKTYFSDTDLQLRLLQQFGRDTTLQAVRYLPLRHLGHATAHRLSSSARSWRIDRDQFQRKWQPPPPPPPNP
jgi:GT2 family glycosyltransferase